MHKYSFTFLFSLLLFSILHNVATAAINNGRENPLTPKAYLNRYWRNHVNSSFNLPPFLLSKASPLNPLDAATFTKLAAHNSLSSHLSSFCSAAGLLCSPQLPPVLQSHPTDSNFSTYGNLPNFTNYGTRRRNGVDTFEIYSRQENEAADTFRSYSRNSVSHNDKFSHYAAGSNTADDRFNTYGAGASGGKGEFRNYHDRINVQNVRFNSYTDRGKSRAQKFSNYAQKANLGVAWFFSYSKNAISSPNDFNRYDAANLADSNFTNYGQNEDEANDTFKLYGFEGADVESSFQGYGDGGKIGKENFTSYSEARPSTVMFKSYGKNSDGEEINFAKYSDEFTFNDNFTGYGEGAQDQKIKFSTYGLGPKDFKEYAKNGVTFMKYNVTSPPPSPTSMASKSQWVEPGKFFRESMLKEGTIMAMPDIRDKTPKRWFLPRSIVSKLPFSSAEVDKIKEIYGEIIGMETMVLDAIKECERAPSRGETKHCVGSAEDLIDFVTSVLGRNVVVRTTENVNGWKKDILIGEVKKINGGRVTKSVSCHQSLYPYLLYYCHSVPKVRVYEADILDSNSKAKINHGVAICHLDTSYWSSGHGAFLALGSGPGLIEVCHWIFENDMTWSTGDE